MPTGLEGDTRDRDRGRVQLSASPELAWLVGALSGKGRVNNKTGEISFTHQNEQVQDEFIRLGEQAFGVEIPYRSLWTFKGREPITFLAPSFFNTRIARELGDLSRTQFPRTIEDNHSWILQDPASTLRYTEGLFESRGSIYRRSAGASKDIIFQTSFPQVSDFIADVLTKIGVTPTIIRMRMGSEMRTRGVTISTLPEQKKFAELVHSLDPEKEDQLKEFRGVSLEGVSMRVKSQDELIDEWRRMADLLGHPPNSNEINALREDGKTKWAHQTYTFWFGESESGNKFSTARKHLISITNPDLAQAQSQSEALAKRHRRRSHISQKRARKLEAAQEREQKRKESEQALQPSKELAWVLGLLASGGNVNFKTGSMALMSQDRSLQNAYINTAGNLFRTNLTWQTIGTHGNERQVPNFNNAAIARQIGDLKRGVWPHTISERHSWVTEDQTYIWSFLSGIFDDRGVFSGSDRNHIVIPTVHRRVANFIAELMANVNIQNPLIARRFGSSAHKDNVQGVGISNIKDLQRFSANVNSVVPAKEQALESIRQNTTRKPRDQAPLDEGEMVAEWKRLYDLLGHPPNVTDIEELHSEGKTRWSAGVYSRVFGSSTGTNEGRSYEVALGRLAAACGIESTDPAALRYRRPDSKYTHIKDPTDLILQYKQLRDMTLEDKGSLPVTSDFERARKTGLIGYSRVTFANYFGDGNLSKAREELERLLQDQHETPARLHSQSERFEEMLKTLTPDAELVVAAEENETLRDLRRFITTGANLTGTKIHYFRDGNNFIVRLKEN